MRRLQVKKTVAGCMLAALGLVLCSCGTTRQADAMRQARVPVAPAENMAVYNRSNAWFTDAFLWKPMGTDTNLAFALAPLMVQELTKATNDNVTVFIGTGSPAEIHAFSDAAVIGGRQRARITYVWQGTRRVGAPEEEMEQALRITLDSGGHPVIWEILRDRSDRRVLYVAQSLEEKAVAEFGKPLPGRSHSTEPALDTAPEVVVARVLVDGPVPMGPMLYVDTGGDLVTVICRCMPAQASSMVSSRYYELKPGVGPSPVAFDDRAVASLRLPSDW
jgi:hypothetical protein